MSIETEVQERSEFESASTSEEVRYNNIDKRQHEIPCNQDQERMTIRGADSIGI